MDFLHVWGWVLKSELLPPALHWLIPVENLAHKAMSETNSEEFDNEIHCSCSGTQESLIISKNTSFQLQTLAGKLPATQFW